MQNEEQCVKYPVTLGVVCLARTTYDYIAAEDIYAKIRSELRQIEGVNWYCLESLIISQEDGLAAAKELATKQIDGLVCISGTFILVTWCCN